MNTSKSNYVGLLFQLFRMPEWIKNLLLFAPAFFGQVMNLKNLELTTLGFFAFCFVSSAGYLINDYCDKKYDQFHPIKKKRPYAGELIATKNLFTWTIILLIIGSSIGIFLNMNFLLLLIGYFGLSVTYSLFLKSIPYIDVLTIVSGFVLRTYAGGAIVNVPVSTWLIVMLIMLTLLVAIGKRRSEVLLYQKTGIKTRTSINKFNLTIINSITSIICILLAIFYFTYSINGNVIHQFGSTKVVLTSIPVMLGVGRYLFLQIKTDKAESPVQLFLNDPYLILIFISWISMFGFFIYG